MIRQHNPETIPQVPATQTARWQRAADRFARYGWAILFVAVTVALLGGGVSAAVWHPGSDNVQVEVPCANPPCFGGGGMPGLRDLPFVVAMLGYLLAIVFGVPSLLAGLWDVLHGRWAVGTRWFLPFIGPVLFFIGTEIVPHLLNPCFWALEWSGKRLSEVYCAYNLEWGADLTDRWHLLDHTLVGTLPMAILYWWALHRWRPSIIRFRSSPSPRST